MSFDWAKYGVTLDDATTGSNKLTLQPLKTGTDKYATSSDYTPAAGDFHVSKKVKGSAWGSEANIGTAPTWVGGSVVVILSGTELTCEKVRIRVENAAISSETMIVWTFGDPSAAFPGNYADVVRMGMTALPNVASGSAGAIPTTGTGANQISVSGGVAKANVVQIDGATTTDGAASLKLQHLWVQATDAQDAVRFTAVGGGYGQLIKSDSVEALYVITTADDRTGAIFQGGAHSSIATYGAAYFGADSGIFASIQGNLSGSVGSTGSISGGGISAGSFANNAITAASIAASALNGKGDWGTSAQVANIQNNTWISHSIPVALEIPDSSSEAISISFVFNDETGSPKNLDSGNPAITLANNAGTDRSGRLGGWTNPATGKYVTTYTNTAGDAIEGLHWDVTGTINAKLRRTVQFMQLVDTTAVDFTAADRTKLNTVFANADVATSTRLATAGYTAPDNAGITSANTAIGTANTTLTAIKGAGWVSGDNLHQIRVDISNVSGGGGGGGAAGSGADACTLHFRNTIGGGPIPDADVWITSDAAGTAVVAGTLQTDSAGDVTFMLDAGVTYYVWLQKDGVNSIRAHAYVAVAD